MGEDSRVYYETYVKKCLNCGDGKIDQSGTSAAGKSEDFTCMICEHRESKGVLLNSKRTFLSNVG